MGVEENVRKTYSEGAARVVESLCCPVTYDQSLLKCLPQEIIERDYGCGDPSRYVRPGDVVLDLGSGGGKICYMAAQLVGPGGRVIGVDMNDDMLALARKHQPEMARILGEDRVQFFKGRIQDLARNQEDVEAKLAAYAVMDTSCVAAFDEWERQQCAAHPMIPDESVDLVISNCVLNLVDDDDKGQLVSEIYRVLKPGGRVAISDIVADAPIPDHLKADPELWSGCISGAFQEAEFIKAFRDVGLEGVAFDKWESTPWRVVEGVSFRSVTLTAVKRVAVRPSQGECVVLYRGPFAVVEDEAGGRYPVGERVVVSQEVFDRLSREPFADFFVHLTPDPVKANASCGCGPRGCC
ncbi:MAG: methyltransferase domain-containing protein [Magnetococcales bacterium]|nr:methyltransferase domain-containing protein [Magnetococcales bacterium]MBF0437604.1 methyltransferase domain-containing protein [Magnetococcales bacterium]